MDKEKKGYVNVNDISKIPEIEKNPLRFYICQFMIKEKNRKNEEVDFEKFVKLIDIFKNSKTDEQYRCKFYYFIIFIF